MHLTVITGGMEASVDAYCPGPFDFDVHPVRPGVAHDAIDLMLEPELAVALEDAAAKDGVPGPLWAFIAIESQRVVANVAVGSRSTRRLEERLTTEAAVSAELPLALRNRRLVRYARALREATPRRPVRTSARLSLAVPQHISLAWAREAADDRMPAAAWAEVRLQELPAGRIIWEAAAAEAGQTLAEWITAYAARRSSS